MDYICLGLNWALAFKFGSSLRSGGCLGGTQMAEAGELWLAVLFGSFLLRFLWHCCMPADKATGDVPGRGGGPRERAAAGDIEFYLRGKKG